MAKVLVTGGAGYIGSHTVVDLISSGHTVISLDNYVNSDESVYGDIAQITGKEVTYHQVDLRYLEQIEVLFEQSQFDAIIHFAALKSVGDSVKQPLDYYENNIVGLINLLKCMTRYKVQNFIFSSSCSVYGNSHDLPVTENTPLGNAESPYARTKQIGEHIIRDIAQAQIQLNFCILRYFNPAGAHHSIKIGESARNIASNLVPVITETAIGKREGMQVFGDDYMTRDGTCIRDYIHVMDLARAHTLSVDYLIRGRAASNVSIFNLGSGSGSTVLEVIQAFEKESGNALNYKIVGRRAGDVEAVFADYSLAQKELGWSPKYSLEDIMRTAWEWEQYRTT